MGPHYKAILGMSNSTALKALSDKVLDELTDILGAYDQSLTRMESATAERMHEGDPPPEETSEERSQRERASKLIEEATRIERKRKSRERRRRAEEEARRRRRDRPHRDDPPRDRSPGGGGQHRPDAAGVIAPIVKTPSPQDTDYVVRPGAWRENKASGSDTWHSVENPVAAAFWHWVQDHPNELVTIGVVGHVGRVALAGGYGKYDNGKHGGAGLFYHLPDGTYGDVAIELVGLPSEDGIKPSASFMMNGKGYGRIAHFATYELGHRGMSDSFILRQQDPVGTMIAHRCWFEPGDQFKIGSGALHTSGWHLGDGWDTLIISEWVFEAACAFKEHMWYLKGGGDCYIINNDLTGAGNRTASHYRPHVGRPGLYKADFPAHELVTFPHNTPRPTGVILCEGNYADEASWHSLAAMGNKPSGGSLMTFWCNPDHPTILRNNTIGGPDYRGAAYGCVTFSWQPTWGTPSKTPGNYINDAGYVHRMVIIEGNKLWNTQATRNCVGISGAQEVWIGEGNEFHGPENRADLMLDSETAFKWSAPPNGQVSFSSEDAYAKIARVSSYLHDEDRLAQLSRDELAMLISDAEEMFAAPIEVA